MTVLISIAGILGRVVGDVLGSTLGWASSLLFGRVPRSHQVLVNLMLAGSLLWVVLVVAVLIPSLGSFFRSSTPGVGSVDVSFLRIVVLVMIGALPAGIGLAAYLAPSRADRARGVAAVGQVLRGYPLAVVLAVLLLVFLPAVGLDRKIRSLRRRWSDIHIPIVVKPGEYDQMVEDLRAALEHADLPLKVEEAPRVLSVPGRLLALVADGNVGHLSPDRLVELTGPELEIGVYPFDIAISGGEHERTRARAVIVSRLATSSVHFTTSAESQAVEDRLEHVARAPGLADGELEAIDGLLLDLDVDPGDWDILYRRRLQIERDALRG
jgi:hypothetical protein